MDDWRPTAGRAALEARAKLLGLLRAFLGERGVLEVETPVFSAAGNSDPAITQWRTEGQPPLWLRSSPEYALKRLLAAGAGDVFELGRVFRRGEAGARHNPEFTLLEWYRVGWTFRQLMEEVAELVNHCGESFGRRWRPVSRSYRELVAEHAGLDPLAASEVQLARRAAELGLSPAHPGSWQRDDWLDLLFSHAVQPALPDTQLTLVYDFPASQAALARVRPGDPPLAERFEALAGGVELANGYQELTDPREQRRRFEAENRRRRARGGQAVPLDERLLLALEHGLPPCSGVALGVDRLLLCCLGAGSLDEVLPFPADRA